MIEAIFTDSDIPQKAIRLKTIISTVSDKAGLISKNTFRYPVKPLTIVAEETIPVAAIKIPIIKVIAGLLNACDTYAASPALLGKRPDSSA